MGAVQLQQLFLEAKFQSEHPLDMVLSSHLVMHTQKSRPLPSCCLQAWQVQRGSILPHAAACLSGYLGDCQADSKHTCSKEQG